VKPGQRSGDAKVGRRKRGRSSADAGVDRGNCQPKQQLSWTPTKVHRLRFLKQTLYPVRCLAWEPNSKRLAVSRNEGSIELWSFHADPTRSLNNVCWFVERRIPGALERKTEVVVWCRGRLFAAGTSGLLLEFDAAFNVAREIPASAGGVVAVAANEKLGKIALASIDGTVLVYDVDEDRGLVYDKTLEKRQERIMSLGWHEDGETLVTGCKGHILIWSLSTGRVQSHIPLAKTLTKRKGKRGRLLQKSILIWALKVLADGTIVTGDSEGTLSLWDLKTATLKTQFKTHRGPILTVCLDKDEKNIWCSGVDPRVVEIRRRPAAPTGWQLGHVNTVCMRDVHAMTHVHCPGFTSDGIVFAGDDPRLYVTRTSKDYDRVLDSLGSSNARLTPAPACVSSMISVSRNRDIVVSRVNRGIEIWRLGSSSSSSSSSPLPAKGILPLESPPTKLALIPGRKDAKDYYCSAVVNADATLLCVSDRSQTNVFRLVIPESSVPTDADAPFQISKIKALNGTLAPNVLFSDFCSTTAATADVKGDELLVTVGADGRLEALRIRRTKSVGAAAAEENDSSSSPPSSSPSSSSDLTFRKMAMTLPGPGLPTCLATRTRLFRGGEAAPFAAVGFASGRVEVVDLLDGRVVASLPVLEDVCVSAVAFSRDAAEVTAVYVNREVAFFSLDSQKTTYWPRVGDDLAKWRRQGTAMTPILKAVYTTQGKLLMHSDRTIYVLNRKTIVGGGGAEAAAATTTADEDGLDSGEEEVEAKKPKLVEGGGGGAGASDAFFQFRAIGFIDVVHFVEALENGELVVAETTVEKVENGMPEPLLKKKYGT